MTLPSGRTIEEAVARATGPRELGDELEEADHRLISSLDKYCPECGRRVFKDPEGTIQTRNDRPRDKYGRLREG